MRGKRWIGAGAAVGLMAIVAGAGELVHLDPKTRYAIAAPPAPWKRVTIEGADFAFTDAASGVTLVVNATCDASKPVPLPALTAHLMIDLTDRKIEPSREVTIDGRAALATAVAARLDGAEVKMDLRVVQIDACVYDFSYVAPPGAFGRGMADFDALVASFHADRK